MWRLCGGGLLVIASIASFGCSVMESEATSLRAGSYEVTGSALGSCLTDNWIDGDAGSQTLMLASGTNGFELTVCGADLLCRAWEPPRFRWEDGIWQGEYASAGPSGRNCEMRYV